MTNIVWEEPSSPRSGRPSRQDWAAIAAVLRDAPGKWAIVDSQVARASASNLNRGVNLAFPRGEFEFVSREWDPSTARYKKLYGRFTGKA